MIIGVHLEKSYATINPQCTGTIIVLYSHICGRSVYDMLSAQSCIYYGRINPYAYIIRKMLAFSCDSVLSLSCNPHNQQNKWGSPELHSCAYKVAPDFEGILAFHAGSALCIRYF